MKSYKLDESLLEVVSLNLNKSIDCIAYISDVNKAKKFFHKEEIIEFFPIINAVGINVNYKRLFEASERSWIRLITKQSSVMALMNVASKILKNENELGEDVTIAYIDTGISPHIDFTIGKNRIIEFIDLVNSRRKPYDDNGHGTFVSGVGSGNGYASAQKYKGIAPKSKIVSIKALNEKGEASAIKILEAMQWIFDYGKKYDIKVVCMSFGSNPLGRNDPLVIGAEMLWNMGIVVVAAAGNSGPENYTIKAPGYSSKIITVGGLDDQRDEQENFNYSQFKIASFSSRGPAGMFFKPDLIAPAVNIIGACFNTKTGDFYAKMSGTSVATPMIAGISLLIISKYPNITPDQLKIRLLRSCRAITHNKNEEGFGLLVLDKFNF